MTRIAYLDPVGGLAGDMILAALLDVGAPREALDATVEALGVRDVAIDVVRAPSNGADATRVNVRTADRTEPRPARELRAAIDSADLPAFVRTRSLAAFDRLAASEAEIHGVTPSDVVLHELGGDDTLVDVCGAFALLNALEIDRVVSAPIPIGRGLIDMAHGVLPAPGPATLRLLEGVPVVGVATPGELVTPTGAAVVVTAADAFGEVPAMTLLRAGTGAGTRVHEDRPNLVRVLLGEAADAPETSEVSVLEANVDDLLPELVPDVVAACLDAGAIDVWTTPVQMKKGRPGLVVSVLVRPAEERRLAATLLRHSTSLGVRVHPLRRYELDRAIREVHIDGHPVRVKIGLLEGRVVNVAPEHDDCAAVARATRRPVKQIWAEALAAATTISEEIDDHAR